MDLKYKCWLTINYFEKIFKNLMFYFSKLFPIVVLDVEKDINKKETEVRDQFQIIIINIQPVNIIRKILF